MGTNYAPNYYLFKHNCRAHKITERLGDSHQGTWGRLPGTVKDTHLHFLPVGKV